MLGQIYCLTKPGYLLHEQLLGISLHSSPKIFTLILIIEINFDYNYVFFHIHSVLFYKYQTTKFFFADELIVCLLHNMQQATFRITF